MPYKPEGYCWLGIAPETKEELSIEKLEDTLSELSKEYKKTNDEKVLKQIEQCKQQIKELQNKPR